MIAYFDTSSLVPLIVDEPVSGAAVRIWDAATVIFGVRLVYMEGHAALAMAMGLGRLSSASMRTALAALGRRYEQMAIVEVSDALVRRASALAEQHGLRGYDAVHLAAARSLSVENLVFVSGDVQLGRAAVSEELALART